MNVVEPIISLKSVSYTHIGKDTPALQDVNLNIRPGLLTMIVGPSGSGKTTLCDIIAGVIPHLYGGELSGEVIIAGIDTAKSDIAELAAKVGKVFQDPEVMFSMLEVEDEIAFGPENLGQDQKTIAERVEYSLEYANLKNLRHNLVWELSGGQAQRLGIGCILAMRPPIIILDEPTANLDPISTRYVHSLALRLKEEGTTVILVTKETDEFLEQADEIIVLDGGRVMCCGTPQDVLDHFGDELQCRLGVWLPEVCEIGLGLRSQNLLPGEHIPLSVGAALDMFEKAPLEFGPDPGGFSVEPSFTPETAGSVLISARDLVYSYPGDREALKGISFEVYRGDILAIVGRNGAGKSTLSKLLVGLLKPKKGQLSLFGKNASGWGVAELSQKISLVFQNPEHQFLTDTVFDEIGYSYLSKTGGEIDPQELKDSVNRVLRMLDLEDVAQDHPFALSAGKKRRLGVAAMLVGSPEILVVDEPTYGQDKAMTDSLMKLILQLHEMGITILMITHNMRLVQEYARRVIVMNEGLITLDGSPRQLFACPEILEQASLAVTTLQTLVNELGKRGRTLPPEVKSVPGFLRAIQISSVRD